MSEDGHTHNYKKITGTRINKIDNDLYKGTAGDTTILYYECACGHKRAFDYGSTEHMRIVWQEVMKRKVKNDDRAD